LVPDILQWLDLVATGTICDVVPLKGLNRAFVRRGLELFLITSRNCEDNKEKTDKRTAKLNNHIEIFS
ncbi:MAG: hypothetical protein L3J56_09245, partial [Bacteroidales bacterium]|nr:hypothetical protein [Bacteroidales bacterium]